MLFRLLAEVVLLYACTACMQFSLQIGTQSSARHTDKLDEHTLPTVHVCTVTARTRHYKNARTNAHTRRDEPTERMGRPARCRPNVCYCAPEMLAAAVGAAVGAGGGGGGCNSCPTKNTGVAHAADLFALGVMALELLAGVACVVSGVGATGRCGVCSEWRRSY